MNPADLPPLAQIQQALNHTERAALTPLPLVVLRNVTVEPIEPYLRYLAAQCGLDAQVRFGEFDNIAQDALAAGGPIVSDTEGVLVFCSLEGCSPLLSRRFAGTETAEVARECERIVSLVSTTVTGIRRRSPALILWHAFESPVHPAFGALDSQLESGQRATVQRLNERIRAVLSKAGGAYLVDMDVCIARLGATNFYDRRYWHIGRAPYGRRGLAEIAGEDMKFLRALKGKARKCLVLDCDNTLWGGIVGEDGLEGIHIGASYPGSAYLELQQQVLDLHSRGIAIALCSKNNEDEVRRVLRDHPDMALREQHIAAARIDWRDKVTNLREIAAELNIGLDSLVFVDDSPFEIELVRQALPQVATILLPQDRAAEYRDILAGCGLFDTLAVSAEDRGRGEMYRAAAERERVRIEAVDLDAYLRGLEMELQVQRADAVSIPRIAQLTQKTNQFNLTTRRYAESEIAAMVADQTCEVLLARLRDRFGDYGIIGVCILRFQAKRALVDSFLLSCRALGRGVEQAFIGEAMRRAYARGVAELIGEYLPTAKNAQTSSFFPQLGFTAIATSDNPTSVRYRLNLRAPLPPPPAQFARIVTDL